MNRNWQTHLANVGLLMLVGLLLFHELVLPQYVLFSNDLPFGTLSAAYNKMPQAVAGSWHDLNWIGLEIPCIAPGFHTALRLATSPELFFTLHGPLALLFLGVSACVFFQRAGLGRGACLLGSLAVVLNTSVFSAACWGVMGFVLTWAYCFLALAALWPWTESRIWMRTMLAGFALGMAINDGIDVAALFSLLIAAAVMYGEWLQPGPPIRRLLRGGLRTATIAVCSALISAHALSSLVSTQIRGVGVLQEEQKTRAEQWNWATQWSLPKAETLGFAVPGLFGYRMDTPDGGNYWGSLGRDPRLDDWFKAGRTGAPPSDGFRFSGGGTYAGALVLLVILWVAQRSLLSKDEKALSAVGRRWVWFWLGAAIVGLVLAWGRFAPFYQLFYALPGAGSVRNPIKFGHMTSFALVILFAYGVDGLFRLNQAVLASTAEKGKGILAAGWSRVRTLDNRFAWTALGLLGVVGLGALLYASSRPDLEHYLQSVQFDPELASAIAKFSIAAAGWGFVRYALAVAAVFLLMSGWFAGARARWGAVVLGAVLLVDLVPANQPWIVLVDVPRKYSEDAVVELLKKSSPESRVALLPFSGPKNHSLLSSVYGLEWAQHHFQAENIQSLDVVQMPRPPADRLPFEMALQPAGDLASLPVIARRWELTGTRYLIGSTEFQLPWGVEEGVAFLNRALDPERSRFRVAERFGLVPKPWVTQPQKYEDFHAVLATNGPFAVFEFAGALPKAGLYTQWQVETNDDVTLKTIASRDFDPHASVMVVGDIGQPVADAPSNSVIPVEFISYAPKTVVLRAQTEDPAVLLLNDRYDPDWTVSVDGQPAELLRCNFIMRGVRLEPGEHTVEFALRPSLTGLRISLASIGFAAVLLGVLAFSGREPTPAGGSSSHADSSSVKALSGDRGTTKKA